MIQRFADWLVYDIFGLSADTLLGIAVNFFFYDTVKILILLRQIQNSGFWTLSELLGASCKKV